MRKALAKIDQKSGKVETVMEKVVLPSKRVFAYVRDTITTTSAQHQSSEISKLCAIRDYTIVELVDGSKRSLIVQIDISRLLDKMCEGDIFTVWELVTICKNLLDLGSILTRLKEKKCFLIIAKIGVDTTNLYGRMALVGLEAAVFLQEDISREYDNKL